MRTYNPNFRINDPIYLLTQVTLLKEIAQRDQNSSSLIYACLDSRIALELIDLNLILASVNLEERELIIEESKPKNGIEKVNKKQGSLKERYQLFYQAVCEVLKLPGNYYDFKTSKNLQTRLSTYIHSYYMTEEEINFNSEIIQSSLELLNEVDDFIRRSLIQEGTSYNIQGIEIESIPEEDKLLLNQWKINLKMDFEELKNNLIENLNKLFINQVVYGLYYFDIKNWIIYVPILHSTDDCNGYNWTYCKIKRSWNTRICIFNYYYLGLYLLVFILWSLLYFNCST